MNLPPIHCFLLLKFDALSRRHATCTAAELTANTCSTGKARCNPCHLIVTAVGSAIAIVTRRVHRSVTISATYWSPQDLALRTIARTSRTSLDTRRIPWLRLRGLGVGPCSAVRTIRIRCSGNRLSARFKRHVRNAHLRNADKRPAPRLREEYMHNGFYRA